MSRIFSIILLVIGLFGHCLAQTKVLLKDPNLTSCLKAIVPSAFTGDSLIPSIAATFTQKIDCGSKGITSIDGIQYFKSTIEVVFNDNQIKVVPSLAGMDALQIFNTDNNLLDSVASFQVLPNLKDISMIGCKLKKLPSFNGMTSLRNLQFPNNNFTQIPDLKGCVNIQKLSFRNSTTVDSLPDFTLFPNLTIAYFENMDLKKMPDLSQNLALKEVLLSGNYFTFKDLLQIAKWTSFPTLKQDIKDGMKQVQMPSNFSVIENQALTIKLPIDDTVSTNRYHLYRNGIWLKDNNQNSFQFGKITILDTGLYHVEVDNISASLDTIGMKLYTSIFRISVVPCFAQSTLRFSITNQDCNTGTNISIDEGVFLNSKPPYSYIIQNINTNQSITSEVLNISNLTPAHYKVEVKDANNCLFQSGFELKKHPMCDDVINPKSEGANKIFYFDYNGSIKIMGPTGKIVKTYNANGFWDGTDGDGKIVPVGFYTLLADSGNVWHVTVLH